MLYAYILCIYAEGPYTRTDTDEVRNFSTSWPLRESFTASLRFVQERLFNLVIFTVTLGKLRALYGAF